MSYSPLAFGITASGQSQAGKFMATNESGDFEFQDNDKLIFGADADASIYSDNSSLLIANQANYPVTIGHASSTVTVAGNLTVTGTTTTVDTVTMNAANAIVFEGTTADAFETTLTIIDPTTPSKTIYLPNANGYLPVLAVASTTAISSTPEELNILDGATLDVGELNLLDGSSAGTVANSKAVIYSAAGIVQATDLKVPDGGGIHNASVADMILLNAAEVVFKDGSFTVDIASHDAANYGLKLGGTLITATAAELNILDGVTSTAAELNLLDGSVAGTAVASKAVVLDASKNIATIGTIDCGAITSTGSSSFGATSFGDNDITNVGNIALDSITADGSTITITGNTTFADGAYDFDIASHDTSNGLKLGGALVTATAAELNILDGVTTTASEINKIDGGTAREAVTIVDADGILLNDGGTMKMVLASSFKTYASGGSTVQSSFSNLDTVDNDYNLVSAAAGSILVKVPENSTAGTKYTIKKTDGTANTVTVSQTTDDLIDGAATKILYFQHESLTVVSDGANWHIV
jgi:hypothetical protein